MPFTRSLHLRIYERLFEARVGDMGLSYLHFQQASKLVAAREPAGKLLLLEVDPLPMLIDHVTALVAESREALASIIDCAPQQIGRVRADSKPVCNVTPNILVEAGKRFEIIEIMAERPRGLTQARRFDKALGTDRLQSEGVREALAEAGFPDLRARTSVVTIVATDFSPAQQSAALRLGFRLRRLVLACEEKSGELYFLLGSPKDAFPTETAGSVGERQTFATTVADEVRRFLSATEWKVDAPVEALVKVYLELPGRSEPVSLDVRPLITTERDRRPGLLVELRIKDGTRAVDARRIELNWGEGLPIRCEGARLWRTIVSLEGSSDHAITRLLFPVREVHDAVETARVA
jgi:hypothetical protein